MIFLLQQGAATLALVFLIVSAIGCATTLSLRRPTLSIVAAGVLFYAATVVCGYILSLLGRLGTPGAWLAASVIIVGLTFLARRCDRFPTVPVASPHGMNCSPWLYPGLLSGFAVVVGIVLVDLVIVCRVAPHTWDVMVYHLTRMAYFLQSGSLDWYPANYWSQVQHAKNSAILDIFVYLAFFRHDSFIQIIQLGAYLISGVATFAIARQTGAGMCASLVAALVFLLSINVVFQSSTAQNDLLLTGCLASALLFWLRFTGEGRLTWLVLCATTIGLALGTKASALGVMPSLALIGIAACIERRKHRSVQEPTAKKRAGFAVVGLIVVAVFSLPAGYADNMFRYGHPLGDRQMRTEHTFQGWLLTDVIHEATLNSARLAADVMRLDGFPDRPLAARVGATVQSGLRSLLAAAGSRLDAVPNGVPFGLGVETLGAATPNEWSFVGMHEDWSFVGPLNLLLLVPTALAGAFICRRRPLFWGSVAAGILLVIVMAARPYQPFLGRFFTIFPVLLAPAVALVIDRLIGRKFPAIWISVALMIAAVSAVYAVHYRSVSPFPDVLALTRIEQLTRQRPELTETLRRYEERVPKDATVISVLGGDSYEYPFFGEGLTRTLIPGGAWPSVPLRPVASAPGFLLYNVRVEPRDCDMDLGAGYRLRDLSVCSR